MTREVTVYNIIPDSRPPAWAAQSCIDGEGVSHSLELGLVSGVPEGTNDGGPAVTVALHRYDQLDVTLDGVRVTPAPVELFVGDHRIPLASAAPLAALIIRAVEAAGEQA